VTVLGEWSIVLALHCSHTVTACSCALQALTVLHTHTSCRPMMALTSGALEMCTRALGTCVARYTDKPARLFFMLEARGPQGAMGHVQRQSPPQVRGEVRSHKTRGSTGAHLGWEVRSRAVGHVAVPEPTSAGR
jgi:hypothetical protein